MGFDDQREMAAASAQLARAIRERRMVSFSYKQLPRVAQPVALGFKKGALEVQALQVGGQSASGSLPHWRRFAVRELSALTLLPETFTIMQPLNITDFDTLIARL